MPKPTLKKKYSLGSAEIGGNLKSSQLFDYDAWTTDCEFHHNLCRNPDDRPIEAAAAAKSFQPDLTATVKSCSVKNALSLTFRSWSWHKSCLHSSLTSPIPTSSLFLFIFFIFLPFFHPAYSMQGRECGNPQFPFRYFTVLWKHLSATICDFF